ncbi:MAG: hypothetical protein NC078_08600 [Ruminococcus sp.]|nr:hypothetical protein [Ruminococcus sp.]
MNNDLNNMTKRYKDEMMRLYRQSGAAKGQQSSGIMGMGAGMSGNTENSVISPSAANRMAVQAQDYAQANARNSSGTAVPGIPGASFYGGHHHGMHGGNMQGNMSGSVTAECQCRFPTAESIIGGMTPIEPRVDSGGAESSAYGVNSGSGAENAAVQGRSLNSGAVPMSDSTAVNTETSSDDGETALRSFIINAFPFDVDYSANDTGESTGEIYPDFALPADLAADARGEVPSTARFFPSVAWINLTGDNGWGFLQVEVFDQGDMPIQGAFVTVKKIVNNGGIGLMRFLYTNADGLTPTIALPAPLIMPLTAQSTTPFSGYSITVRARGFLTMRNIQVPIYAGSKLVQPVQMRSVYPNLIQPRSDSADVG